jgi:hypothetical protein
MSSDTTLRIAQTLGITTSAILSGYVASVSMALVPRLLESPTPLLLRQWKSAYHSGKTYAPPFAALSSACYFYLYYKSKHNGYLTAGALTIGIVPYTLLVLMGTNKKLLAKAEEAKTLGWKDELVEVGLGNETAHKLVDNWGILNLGRAVLLSSASVVAIWTAVGMENVPASWAARGGASWAY